MIAEKAAALTATTRRLYRVPPQRVVHSVDRRRVCDGAQCGMDRCEVIPVPQKKTHTFAWKWRHTSPDGRVTEAKHAYELYYECVCAARKQGYALNTVCS